MNECPSALTLDDILSQIFRQLVPGRDLYHAALVCKQWAATAGEDELWRFYLLKQTVAKEVELQPGQTYRTYYKEVFFGARWFGVSQQDKAQICDDGRVVKRETQGYGWVSAWSEHPLGAGRHVARMTVEKCHVEPSTRNILLGICDSEVLTTPRDMAAYGLCSYSSKNQLIYRGSSTAVRDVPELTNGDVVTIFVDTVKHVVLFAVNGKLQCQEIPVNFREPLWAVDLSGTNDQVRLCGVAPYWPSDAEIAAAPAVENN